MSIGQIMAEATRDDAALLRRFQSSQDEDAFGELVRRHGPLVWSVCRRRLERLEDAEDAFQTTFLILAIKSGTIRNPASLASWLHRTATRAARRVATHSPREPTDTQHNAGLDALAEITRREAIAAVDDELQALPSHYRDALVLFHLEGLARQDVASRLGVSEPTVKARLSRGRSLLRTRLARRGVALPLLLPLATTPLPAGLSESAARLGATFGRTRITPGDLLTTTLTQGANPMLSLITGKTGLAILAVCLGLTAAWAVKEPLRAGDGNGEPETVIDTTLKAPKKSNDRLLALLDKGTGKTESKTEELIDSTEFDDSAGKSQESGSGIALEPAQQIRVDKTERKIFEELSSTAKLKFSGIPLRDALEALADQHEIPIVFDIASIEADGATLDNNVDLFINGIKLASALDLLLEPEDLAYHVEDEVLKVTSRGELAERVATRAYYIPDLGQQESKQLGERLIGLLVAERGSPLDSGPIPIIEVFGDRLLMNGTVVDHKNLQEILQLIYFEPGATENE